MRVFGVARSGVASVKLAFDNRSVRLAAVTVDGGFSFDADPEILAAAAKLTTVSALSATGAVMGSQPVPGS